MSDVQDGERDNKENSNSKKSKAPCGQCGKPANLRCSRCKGILYCNPECQRAHWPTHKQNCKAPPKPPPKEDSEAMSNTMDNSRNNDSTSGISNSILRDLIYKAGGATSLSDNTLPSFSVLIEELNREDVMTLQRYIESLRESGDPSPFSSLPMHAGPDQVFSALAATDKLGVLVDMLKKPKLNYAKYKIVEFLLSLLKNASTPSSVHETLLRNDFFNVCLDLFFEQQSDILRSEMLQFLSDGVAENKDINVLLEQGRLIERTISAVEKANGGSVSAFFLALADLLSKSTDERVTTKIGAHSEAWAQIVQPHVERWREQKIWTPESQVNTQSYGSDRSFF